MTKTLSRKSHSKKKPPPVKHPWGPKLLRPLMKQNGLSARALADLMYPNAGEAEKLPNTWRVESWVKGSVHQPRGDELARLAGALKVSASYFRPDELADDRASNNEMMLGTKETAGDRTSGLARPGGELMPDGEKVAIERLDPNQSKMLSATMEVWHLTSDMIAGANYYPGDLVIVDLAAHPRPRDIVLAESGQVPVFRMFIPTNLWAFSLSGQVPPIPVDNRMTTIKGVVVAKLSV